MRRTDTKFSDSVVWRGVAAATACLVLLGLFVAVGHAHDGHELRDADCVGCHFQQTLSLDEPGVDAPVLELDRTPFEAAVSDDPVVVEHHRLAPLRGPPTSA